MSCASRRRAALSSGQGGRGASLTLATLVARAEAQRRSRRAEVRDTPALGLVAASSTLAV